MDSTIPDEQVTASKQEKADLRNQMLPIIKVLDKLDKAKGKYMLKLIDLKARYAIADRELAEGTKLTIVDKKTLQESRAISLEELLKDPEKAKQLMKLLKENEG